MFVKMRELVRISLVCICAFLLVRVSGEDVEVEEPGDGVLLKDDHDRKDGKLGVIAGMTLSLLDDNRSRGKEVGSKRTTTQISANATRDSQLLSLLAARRRQLLHGRVATHINTLATLAQKAKINTTTAHLEIRDSSGSTVKRITLDNLSNESTPTLKLITNDGSKEQRQDIKPHEIRHLFVPKIYHENKSRAGFLNNRRKDVTNKNNPVPESTTDHEIFYVPPEKFDIIDKEIELDPEEEFQVDESNHGLYLLNYSDADNVTHNTNLTKSTTPNEAMKEKDLNKIETTTQSSKVSNNNSTDSSDHRKENENKIELNSIANSTDTTTKLVKQENDKDKSNQTLFMSDEIYNHFRPLETELGVEDMAQFVRFGQKLGGSSSSIGDNLTYSPSLSASTKSVNFIAAPLEKRKYNSRYSATEKYKNINASEDEINEDMDVSIDKNVIEKNKIRNTVRGPAPARHVGLVNAYRKSSTTPTTTKPLSVAQLNITEPIVQNVVPKVIVKSKENSQTNSTIVSNDDLAKLNGAQSANNTVGIKINGTVPSVRNYTRSYHNLRRRPSKLTASPTTESIPIAAALNSTTEKTLTSVYTAVVTSVSITSSIKGQNNTDDLGKDADNSTVSDPVTKTVNTSSTNEPETSTASPSTMKPFRHRIRIRTTTPDNNRNSIPSSTPAIFVDRSSDSSEIKKDLNKEATTSRISERLANLFRQDHDHEQNNGSLPIRPQNILRRKRPTTTSTTTTTTTLPPTTSTQRTTEAVVTSPTAPVTQKVRITLPTLPPILETTENTQKPIIVTSRTSSESRSKPLYLPPNSTESYNKTSLNTTLTKEDSDDSQNEEVVIEAEKTHTTSYVLAGLGFLPVAAVIAFVLRNFMNKKTKEYDGYFEDDEIHKENTITPVARPPLPTPTKPDQKWEFPRNKLRLQTLLGQGNFGQVWKAEADDLNGHDGLTRLVAVKTIKESASQKEKQELLHEIYIMQKIGTHPNVVTVLACCTEQEPYLLIMEYVMCGKLLSYLRSRRSRADRFSGSGALTSRDLTVFAYCVARGMDYIASKGIVHRDLAARNVLVDHNKLCKIADFGMSRCNGSSGTVGGGGRGALPVRWMAPEALLYNVHSHETDVWAFGVLLWEIVTLGSTPYAAMSGREVLTAVTEGYRLERPAHCHPQLYRAMSACWHADPHQRPTFASLKSQLAQLLDNEPSEGNYVDLDSFYQESSVYSDPSAIIQDDDGLSAEFEERCFRDASNGQTNRGFTRDEKRTKFGGAPRMGGFGIRDVPFNDRNFSDGDFTRTFSDMHYPDKNFNDPDFTERKDPKLSTSSFHRDRERQNPIVSRNSFNGFPRVGNREGHFQMTPDGRSKRVPEFECDI